MTNPMINPQPNYSGVTIQIANPAVNVTPNGTYCACSSNCQNNVPLYATNPMGIEGSAYSQNVRQGLPVQSSYDNSYATPSAQNPTGYASAYPAQYYLNNYNYPVNSNDYKDNAYKHTQEYNETIKSSDYSDVQNYTNNNNQGIDSGINGVNDVATDPNAGAGIANKYSVYADPKVSKDSDLTKSQNIISDISEREAAIAEEQKNTKETKIVALTDDYIKSLENYLNNPNQEIRLMASKEILTRLDEDKDRYNDAALNALLNKMLQDPSKLVRISALSAFASQLASGNDFTVTLLQNIQSDPQSDKEDVLQAANILLKMSSETETKRIPMEEYEARVKARADARTKARLAAEADAKVQAEARAKAKAEAEAMAKFEAEQKAQAEAQAKEQK